MKNKWIYALLRLCNFFVLSFGLAGIALAQSQDKFVHIDQNLQNYVKSQQTVRTYEELQKTIKRYGLYMLKDKYMPLDHDLVKSWTILEFENKTTEFQEVAVHFTKLPYWAFFYEFANRELIEKAKVGTQIPSQDRPGKMLSQGYQFYLAPNFASHMVIYQLGMTQKMSFKPGKEVGPQDRKQVLVNMLAVGWLLSCLCFLLLKAAASLDLRSFFLPQLYFVS